MALKEAGIFPQKTKKQKSKTVECHLNKVVKYHLKNSNSTSRMVPSYFIDTCNYQGHGLGVNEQGIEKFQKSFKELKIRKLFCHNRTVMSKKKGLHLHQDQN